MNSNSFDFNISEDEIINTYTAKNNECIKLFVQNFEIKQRCDTNTNNSDYQDDKSTISFIDDVSFF